MTRLRELGISIGLGTPGPRNAITDVQGVRVGHATIIRGDGALEVGVGPVRTGVTVVRPRPGPAWQEPAFAGSHRLNGNGELTGLAWIREAGMLASEIALTNTHSVGVVRDALAAVERAERGSDLCWALPVVGETWDGMLNDVDGQHVTAEHLREALADAHGGTVAEGAVGGGTGMICHGFKGGIGTASRVLAAADGGFTVGALVQANHGRRDHLRVDGAPVGRVLGPERVPLPGPLPQGLGSIIVILATDAPLLPGQCERLAQRATIGVGRAGGGTEDGSGDLFLCFATGNRGLPPDGPLDRRAVHDRRPHRLEPLHEPALRGGGRGDGGGDRERPARGRDDDRPRRHHRPGARAGGAAGRAQRAEGVTALER